MIRVGNAGYLYDGSDIHALEDISFTLEPGERIAQLVILPVFAAEYAEADALSDTERGSGGFGSTGRK